MADDNVTDLPSNNQGGNFKSILDSIEAEKKKKMREKAKVEAAAIMKEMAQLEKSMRAAKEKLDDLEERFNLGEIEI